MDDSNRNEDTYDGNDVFGNDDKDIHTVGTYDESNVLLPY
jgi:hypothetical protein